MKKHIIAALLLVTLTATAALAISDAEALKLLNSASQEHQQELRRQAVQKDKDARPTFAREADETINGEHARSWSLGVSYKDRYEVSDYYAVSDSGSIYLYNSKSQKYLPLSSTKMAVVPTPAPVPQALPDTNRPIPESSAPTPAPVQPQTVQPEQTVRATAPDQPQASVEPASPQPTVKKQDENLWGSPAPGTPQKKQSGEDLWGNVAQTDDRKPSTPVPQPKSSPRLQTQPSPQPAPAPQPEIVTQSTPASAPQPQPGPQPERVEQSPVSSPTGQIFRAEQMPTPALVRGVNVNVRRQPQMNAPVIARISNTAVTITEVITGSPYPWYKVNGSFGEGWVYGQYVGPAEAAPRPVLSASATAPKPASSPKTARSTAGFSAKDVKLMSTFLSNFTEIGLYNISADGISSANGYDLAVRFGILHNYLNNRKNTILPCTVKGCPYGPLTIRVADVQVSVNRYFGVSIKLNKSALAPGGGEYHLQGGMFHFRPVSGAVYYAQIDDLRREADTYSAAGFIYNLDNGKDVIGRFTAHFRYRNWNGRNTYVLIDIASPNLQ